jgi:hypothetical protein
LGSIPRWVVLPWSSGRLRRRRSRACQPSASGVDPEKKGKEEMHTYRQKGALPRQTCQERTQDCRSDPTTWPFEKLRRSDENGIERRVGPLDPSCKLPRVFHRRSKQDLHQQFRKNEIQLSCDDDISRESPKTRRAYLPVDHPLLRACTWG